MNTTHQTYFQPLQYQSPALGFSSKELINALKSITGVNRRRVLRGAHRALDASRGKGRYSNQTMSGFPDGAG